MHQADLRFKFSRWATGAMDGSKWCDARAWRGWRDNQVMRSRRSRACARPSDDRTRQGLCRSVRHHPDRQSDRPRSHGHPVVMVCRPNARSSAVFHGKGIDLAAAKASGIDGSDRDLARRTRSAAARFSSLCRSQQELEDGGGRSLPRIPPSRFDLDAPMLWVEGRNLMDGEPCGRPTKSSTPIRRSTDRR